MPLPVRASFDLQERSSMSALLAGDPRRLQQLQWSSGFRRSSPVELPRAQDGAGEGKDLFLPRSSALVVDVGLPQCFDDIL